MSETMYSKPVLAPGGIVTDKPDNIFIAGESGEYSLTAKTITKKRFIKLLMAKGIQRNNAVKIHEKYKKSYGTRSAFGLEMFVILNETFVKPNKLEIVIGNTTIIAKYKEKEN